MRQVDEGTFLGWQKGITDPVFWVWRPTGSSTEYWVLYKPGQTGGFTQPGPGNTSAEWTIGYDQGGSYSTGCEFLQWVAHEIGCEESDLVVHEHDVTTLDCST